MKLRVFQDFLSYLFLDLSLKESNFNSEKSVLFDSFKIMNLSCIKKFTTHSHFIISPHIFIIDSNKHRTSLII